MVHVAGHPVLDFLGTISERGTADHEELTDPAALATWYVEAGVVTELPHLDVADLDGARAFREHLYAVVKAWMDDGAVSVADRRAVNEVAAGLPPQLTLQPNGTVRVEGGPAHCLAGLARSALQLMRDVEHTQVRWCGDERCTHPFLDTSRAQGRRWCDMSSCGTRNKQRELRARRRTPEPGPGRTRT